MTRSDRMQPIKKLADTRERDAGSVVAEAQKKLQECERKLAQLQQYREEYVASNGDLLHTLDTLRMQNYRAFLQRLADAIRQQEQAARAAREDYERKREAWRERRVEAKSLGRAIENLQTEERKEEAHREQIRMDEQAAAQRRSRELANESGTWKIR